VPIYFGALTSPTVELAGELADGIMPLWWSPERVARSRIWGERGRAKIASRPQLQVALGIPTFIGDGIATLRGAARANLGLLANFPFFQRLLRASGFAAEADRAEQGEVEAALSDRVLDAICLIGPLTRCRERLAAYRDAGVDLPILAPAIDVDSVRAVIRAFRQ
jgi:alkanesulfonate monooxygenase SsuD/methylene tetrahydromethanopterin reductase-like flavin-dependent oxidoreductase (luciferase family)